MKAYGEVTFTGASGNKYVFIACDPGSDFPSDYSAVYFLTRRARNGGRGQAHSSVYVGHTGDVAQEFGLYSEMSYFSVHGANCVCIYPEIGELERQQIEKDLIENYSPPCND